MRRGVGLFVAVLMCIGTTGWALGAGKYYEVAYPPSTRPSGLQVGVTYTMWVPDGAARLRGIIVHQHGCGAPACAGGATAAYDLHWQALAKKWDCALLGPSYQQRDDQNCNLWCDPRKESDTTFLKAIDDLAGKSVHPELKRVPWCLWGHSGGGYWAGIMQLLHPDRIVATWFRSGTAALRIGGYSDADVPLELYSIPMMVNPGVKEEGHAEFNRIWTSCLATFKAYRAKGAPVGLAPDPRTGHECGDSRYLAIPFFDACLAMRLPDKDSSDQKLKPVDLKQAWLATPHSQEAVPAADFKGNAAEAMWLPNERIARAWMEYVKTGAVGDATPPPAPFDIKGKKQPDGSVEITWDADADLESGLSSFLVQLDGKTVAQIPEKPIGRFGRPLFQTMSYHDTPEKPLPQMRFAGKGDIHLFSVIAVNSAGLKSAPAGLASENSNQAAAPNSTDNWPGFRGPTAQGHSDATGLPLTWSETEHVKWKTPIPGEGWSSPVIWGEQVWLTTSLNSGRSFHAICIDKSTGKIIHDIEAFTVEQPKPKNSVNSYASPTPVIEAGRVYVCFGTYGSACIDTRTGQFLWKTQELAIDHMEGPGSSPILYKNLFILHCDGIDQQYIVALDKNTGKIVWKTPRSYPLQKFGPSRRKAFCTPLLVQLGGKDVLLSIAASRLYCYEAATGKELWYFDHPGYSNAQPPIMGLGMIYLSTGYDKADFYTLRADPAASGDITKTHFAWKDTGAVPQKPGLLLIGNELYLFTDTGIGRCLDAKSGKQHWQQRITFTTSASPIYADGRIYVFSERKESVVLKPDITGPQILARNMLENGCMSSPAISGKAMFVRTKTHLYRIEN